MAEIDLKGISKSFDKNEVIKSLDLSLSLFISPLISVDPNFLKNMSEKVYSINELLLGVGGVWGKHK